MRFTSPKHHINQISCKSVTVALKALGDLSWNDPLVVRKNFTRDLKIGFISEWIRFSRHESWRKWPKEYDRKCKRLKWDVLQMIQGFSLIDEVFSSEILKSPTSGSYFSILNKGHIICTSSLWLYGPLSTFMKLKSNMKNWSILYTIGLPAVIRIPFFG